MKKLELKENLKRKLARLPKAARQLYFMGIDPNTVASRPLVAIVGTRKLTPYGKQVTEKLASELARTGVVVVSGLAYGVDITAHKAVLDVGGTTIAVLPSGLENIYPASHAQLAKRIAEQGSLISEYESNHKPWKVEFLERNRIIAAISDAVIITEAAEKSGSLNTAAHAKTMGIPVCAVPGAITSPMSSGTNSLIKQGAHVVTSSVDVLELLGVENNLPLNNSLRGNNDEETTILQTMAGGVSEPDILRQKANLQTADFQMTMTMLEIAGRVKQDGLGRWYIV